MWSDEAHFLSMSAPWQTGDTLSPRGLLKPEGVYWIPIGFYVFTATLFSLIGEVSLTVARAGALACALGGACALAALHRRMLPAAPRSHAAWFGVLWLAGPPTLLSANVARPEALVLALALLGLTYALRARWLGSLACGLLALLVHPLVALPALMSAWLGTVRAQRISPTRAELALALAALALAVAEIARFAMHREAYVADWLYQLGRKSAREIGAVPVALGVLLALCALAPLAARFVRARTARGAALTPLRMASTLASVGLAAIFVQSYGQEMWYAGARFTGIVLVCLAAAALRKRADASVVLIGCLLLLDLGSWGRAFHKGLVQGIPIAHTGMHEAAREKRELNQLLSRALAAPTAAHTLISPFLAAPFVAALQRGTLHAVSELSHPEAVPFSRAVFLTRAYPSFLNDHETLSALAGYRCAAAEHLRTSAGLFDVIVAQVVPAAAHEAGPSLLPCDEPARADAAGQP